MTSNDGGNTRVLGSLSSADGRGVVRMEDRFHTDIEDLWAALTDPRRLVRWLGEIEGDLRLGGAFHARFFDGWEGTGRVETCNPPQRLLVLTKHVRQSDEHALEVRLMAVGDQTVLVFEERGMPLELLAAYGAGDQIHVEDLADYLAGRERQEAEARWNELESLYRDLVDNVG